MSLSVDADLYKYCPGGSTVSVIFVAKIKQNQTEDEALVDPIRVVSHVVLPEYHTRFQKQYLNRN